ncbi:catalase-like [Manduca sexta]|uniref:catalase-like n=1 Tax=Manduca sexta TaxID=7130 RepID=UPI001182BF35|nr:catalase-like [Manduca sexta]
MSGIVILLLVSVGTADVTDDSSSEQLIEFKQKTQGPIGILTTSSGMPVEYKKTTNTLKSNLLFNHYFMESLTHFSRERIPERVVHAVGSGALGYFEVTNDITHICKAKLFNNIGKRTPITVRFSLVNFNLGGAETSRDIRGFGVRFYTEDGNFDIVGLNSPVFSLKDPVFFTSFIRVQRRNPETNMRDSNMIWDFITLRPETFHLFMVSFSDLGIPDGYRYMPGYGIHAFEVVNEDGKKHFVKFNFIPDGGIKNLSTEKAQKIAGKDPDYANRDLYNAIARGNFPSWTLAVQIISVEDVKRSNIDMFDVTRLWPISKYPLHTVGKIVLNENPTNYFAQVEQLALNPAHLVPGINGGPDKIFEARLLSYRDAQYYRLGANFNKIPVNCPIISQTYNRDGRAPVNRNGKNSPNYYPNSFNGAIAYLDNTETDISSVCQDDVPRNTDQIRNMYVDEMNEDERVRLVENIVDSLGRAALFLQERAVKLFTSIHPDFGDRVLHGLQELNKTKLYWDDI